MIVVFGAIVAFVALSTVFWGGWIFGSQTPEGQEALARNTAQLPQIDAGTALPATFADNTHDAILSGCLAAQAGDDAHELHGQVAELQASHEDGKFRQEDAFANLSRSQNALAEKRESFEVLNRARQQAEHQVVEIRDLIRGLRGQAISMVFEDPLNSLDPAFTVGDQIGETLMLHKAMTKSAARQKATSSGVTPAIS